MLATGRGETGISPFFPVADPKIIKEKALNPRLTLIDPFSSFKRARSRNGHLLYAFQARARLARCCVSRCVSRPIHDAGAPLPPPPPPADTAGLRRAVADARQVLQQPRGQLRLRRRHPRDGSHQAAGGRADSRTTSAGGRGVGRQARRQRRALLLAHRRRPNSTPTPHPHHPRASSYKRIKVELEINNGMG